MMAHTPIRILSAYYYKPFCAFLSVRRDVLLDLFAENKIFILS